MRLASYSPVGNLSKSVSNSLVLRMSPESIYKFLQPCEKEKNNENGKKDFCDKYRTEAVGNRAF